MSVLALLAIGLLALGAHLYCWRRRGISLCGALALCPERVLGETAAILAVAENEVRTLTPHGAPTHTAYLRAEAAPPAGLGALL